MKAIFVSGLMSKKMNEKIIKNEKGIPLQSIQKYNRLLCEGIVSNGIKVKTATSLPINKKISSKKVWFCEREIENNIEYTYLPFINIKFLRQVFIFISMLLLIFKEVIFDKEEKVFIVDILNTTLSFVTLFVCKILRIKCIGIVTDLPKDINPTSKSSNINVFLQNKYDGYIFLTKYMNDIVNNKNKPYVVIEGISDCKNIPKIINNNSKKICMYSGGLYEKYGVKTLIEAFLELENNWELHLYGSGDLEDYIKSINNPKVKYGGALANEEIVKKQVEASLLINPRFSNEEYTKYSFPSKNIEYMASGTPVLTTKLKGIPDEYFEYCYVIEDESKNGIKKSLKEIFKKSDNERNEFGEKAQEFVKYKKNKVKQTIKLNKMCEKLIKKDDIKVNKLLKAYLIFLFIYVLFFSRNAMYVSLYLGFRTSYYIMLALSIPLIIFFTCNIFNFNYKIQRNISILTIVDILFLLIILIKKDFGLYNFTNIITINIAFMFSQIIDGIQFKKIFINIFAVLSILSLFNLFILKPTLFQLGLTDSSLLVQNSVGNYFMNFISSFVLWDQYYIRNFSIFTEPAFFQFYLIIALLLTAFSKYDKKTKLFLNIVFAFAMFSTFSAGGIIIYLIYLIYIVIISYINLKGKEKTYLTMIIIFVLLLSIIVIYNIPQLKDMLYATFIKVVTVNDSSSTRFSGIIISLKCFLSSPLIGVPINTFLDNNNITNTPFSIFAIYGITLGTLFIYILIKFSKSLSTNKISIFAIFIMLFLAIMNHIFLGVQSFWFILFSIIFAKKESEDKK